MATVSHGTAAKRMTKSALRYAVPQFVTGAISLTASHDRLAANQPGRRGGGQGRKPAAPRRAQREP